MQLGSNILNTTLHQLNLQSKSSFILWYYSKTFTNVSYSHYNTKFILKN